MLGDDTGMDTARLETLGGEHRGHEGGYGWVGLGDTGSGTPWAAA